MVNVPNPAARIAGDEPCGIDYHRFFTDLNRVKLETSAVSDFMLTVLDDVDQATARATLGVSDENIQDIAGAMVTGGTETGISVTYDDTNARFDFVVDAEFIADTVGAMVSGNTETGITVTYQDSDNTIDFALNGTSSPTAMGFIGMVVPYAGSAAPTGWLLCYGQNVSRTTYAALFAVISTTYGVGDGSSTFGIPDLRGRVVAGQDDMGGTSANRLTSPLNGDTLGASGGAEGVTLTTAEMPAHSHNAFATVNGAAGAGAYALTGAASIDIGIQSAGGGGAHANVQPTLILNYMIFAGV